MSSLKFLPVVVAVLMSFITVSAGLSEKVYVEYSTQPEVIKPGTSGYILLKITNPSTEPISYLYLTRVEADAPLEVYDFSTRLGALYPGDVKQVLLRFRVSEDTVPGFYVVKIFLSANYISQSGSIRYDIPIEVTEEGFLQLSLLPAEIEAEKTENITLKIHNPSGELRDLRISWSGEGVVPVGSSSSIFIRRLGSGATLKVPLSVRAGSTGTAILKFSVTYHDSTGNQRSENHTLGIEVRSREEDYLRVALKPEALKTGRAGRLLFSLSNEGDEELRNVLLSWSSEVLFPASSSSEFFSSIGAGESRNIYFGVLVDENAEPGYYPLYVSLRYDSSGVEVRGNRTFGVEVTGKASLVATLFRAEAGKVFISIANTGNAPAKNLVVRASSPYGRAESFIGDLESGDEEIIEVAQRGAGGRYNVSLTLTYRDVFGQEFEEEKQIEVHHPAGGVPLSKIAAAVLLILIALGAWFWRRR